MARKVRFGYNFFRDLISWGNDTVSAYGAPQIFPDFLKQATIKQYSATAVNVTGNISAAALAGGLITSTSAAPVTATLPTATALAAELDAVQGTVFDFVVDNSAGADTVTIAVNTGITVGTQVITGGNTLTVSTANAVGYFRLIFTSATTAILRRIA